MLATRTKMLSGFEFAGTSDGLINEIAFPIQPPLLTTIADRGSINKILNVAAFLPSSTLFVAINLITKPIFINKNPIEPAIPSCQKIPTKLKSGGLLNLARGIFHSVGRIFQNECHPPTKEIPIKKTRKPANRSIKP